MNAPEDPRAHRPSAAATALGLALLVAAVLLIILSSLDRPDPYLDLRVYRSAVALWWDGTSPYGVPLVEGLVFNYPPSALVLLLPLAILPPVWSGGLLVVVGAFLLVWVCRRALPWSRGTVVAVTGMLAMSEPVLTTWLYGQINLVVLALVTLALLRDGKVRGSALGASVALKIAPAALLLVPLTERRWRAVGSTLVVGAALLALSAVRAPGVVGDWLAQARSGLVAVRPEDLDRNESWRGLLEALAAGEAGTNVWPIVAGVVAFSALSASVLAVRNGRRATAVAILALGVLLASPVSWTHHWVWAPVVLGAAFAPTSSRRLDTAARVAATALVAAMVLWLPTWFAPDDRSLGIDGLTWVLSYSYVLLGTVAFALLVVRELRVPAGVAADGTS